MNSVNLIGRITKDVEIHHTNSGMPYTKFILAVQRSQKNANGERLADFISCACMGNTADFIGKYIKKGNLIGIAGHIQTGSYVDKNGQTQYTTDVYIDRVESLTARDQNQQQQQPVYKESQPQSFVVDDSELPY